MVLAPPKYSTKSGGGGSSGWQHVPAGDYVLSAVARLDLEFANSAAPRN